MKNLNRLSNAANKSESGQRKHDARKSPRCAQCRRAALWLGQDKYGAHCDLHASAAELAEYYSAWESL